MRIMLIGATGFIGRHLVRALVAAGHEVTGCARRRAEAFRCYPDIPWMVGDFVTDHAATDWKPRVAGFDCVINATGILRESGGQTFDAVHFLGPRALYEACVARGVRKVIHISALGCDAGSGRPYEATKMRIEALLAKLDLDWVAVRPSLVYGEDSPSSALFRFLARLPVMPVIAGGGQLLQPIHVDDLSLAVARLLVEGAPNRTVVELGGPRQLSYRDLLAGLRAATFRNPGRYVSVPLALARVGALASDIVGVGPFGTDTLNMLLRGNITWKNDARILLGREPRSVSEFSHAVPQEGTVSQARLTLLYDGACAICNAETGRLRHWNRHTRTLSLVDISADGFDAAPYGKTHADLLGLIHAVKPDGSMLIGVDALRAAYGEVGLGWLWAPTRWPGLRPVFDRFYLWFARNRYRISNLGRCGSGRCVKR